MTDLRVDVSAALQAGDQIVTDAQEQKSISPNFRLEIYSAHWEGKAHVPPPFRNTPKKNQEC
jgi:hypothetical protein